MRFAFVLAADPTQLTVTWVTLNESSSSDVQYGVSDLSLSVQGKQTAFTDGGSEKRTIFVHRATMINLKPRVKYSKQLMQCSD